MVDSFIEYLSDVFTIQTWRSLWYLEDKFMFPDDSVKSAYVSVLLGSSIYLIMYIFNKKINAFVSAPSDPPSTPNKQPYEQIHTHFEQPKKLSISVWTVLYVSFVLGFVATVNLWRGLWMLQLEYCYPLIFHSKVLNQMSLNCVYMFACVLVFWCLDMTSALLSRGNCQDNFFTNEKNYILKMNNFKMFLKQVIASLASFLCPTGQNWFLCTKFNFYFNRKNVNTIRSLRTPNGSKSLSTSYSA